MANSRNSQAITAPLLKSIIFIMVGVLIFAMLFIEIGDIRFKDEKTYKAIFASSSQLQPRSNVTASGVDVGTVKKVEVYDNDKARVEFSVNSDRPLTEGTQLFVRFASLTGDKYLELRPGPGGMKELKDGATIPISKTQPALDLDVLLAGFNPLFEGLGRQDPTQINDLAANIIGVFQGQSGTIGSLLTQTASLAGSLADRDQVIGALIDNLNATLSSLNDRSEKLSATFLKVQELVTGLAENREPLIGEGLGDIGDIAREVGDIGRALENGLDTGIPALKSFADSLLYPSISGGGQTELNRILSLLPGSYLRLGRASTSIAGYALGICQVVLRLTNPVGDPYFAPPLGPNDNDPRCKDDGFPLQGPKELQKPPHAKFPALDSSRFGG